MTTLTPEEQYRKAWHEGYNAAKAAETERFDLVDSIDTEGRAYHDRHFYYPLAWNIKVYHPDGPLGYADEHNPDLDEAWERHLEEDDDDSLFWMCCNNGLRDYLDNNIEIAEDQNGYKFSQAGRSGGWLCLEQFAGCRIMTRSAYDLDAQLRDPREWDIDELNFLKEFVEEMDGIDWSAEYRHQLGFQRLLWEEGLAEVGRLLEVHVGLFEIAQGTPGDMEACPITWAVCNGRQTYTEVSIGGEDMFINGEHYTLPERACAWQLAFDNREEVQPITFTAVKEED